MTEPDPAPPGHGPDDGPAHGDAAEGRGGGGGGHLDQSELSTAAVDQSELSTAAVDQSELTSTQAAPVGSVTATPSRTRAEPDQVTAQTRPEAATLIWTQGERGQETGLVLDNWTS